MGTRTAYANDGGGPRMSVGTMFNLYLSGIVSPSSFPSLSLSLSFFPSFPLSLLPYRIAYVQTSISMDIPESGRNCVSGSNYLIPIKLSGLLDLIGKCSGFKIEKDKNTNNRLQFPLHHHLRCGQVHLKLVTLHISTTQDFRQPVQGCFLYIPCGLERHSLNF